MMRRQILAFAAAAAVALAGSAATAAQDGTPVGEASPVAGGLFDGLGLPELTITVTDDGYSLDQTEVEAGRYLVTLNNESENPQVFAWIAQLPEGRTAEDLSYADEIAAGTPIPDMMAPTEEMLADLSWLYETYLAGGPSTVSDVSRQVVVELPAGEYAIGDEDPFSAVPAASLTVTGEPGGPVSGQEPEAAVTIVEEGEGGVGYSFRIDGELTAGPQIVEVLNASDQPHFVEASQYPEPVTTEQIMASFMFDPSTGATPSPDMLDFEQFTFAGWAGTQSAGTTQWVVMDLDPGQAILACWIPDPVAGGVPHALEGMLQVVDVSGS
jgi:hypothetical protein